VVGEFIEQYYDVVHFRFESVSILRKTSTFGAMNCWVEVTIGEEVMATSRQKYGKKRLAMWMTEALTFSVFAATQQCTIRVMDD
jgi:hypothetical protein